MQTFLLVSISRSRYAILGCIFIFLFLFKPSLLHAQMNAPVMGDAAKLIDLLKKDYNAISPETRDDEWMRDRSQVISIFRSYLSERQVKELQNDSLSASNFINASRSYQNAKLKLSSFNAAAESPDSQIQKDFLEKKEKYLEAKARMDTSELSKIIEQYKADSNLYVSHVAELFNRKYKAILEHNMDALAATNYSSSLQKALPFVGGDLTFEMLIDGLSKFLAKRIKEELTTYVIERVQEWLNNPAADNPITELKVLLPRTTQYLSDFNASQVTSFTNEIKQYIEEDFRNILANAANLRNTPRLQKLITAYPQLDFAFEAFEFIPLLSQMEHPIDYFTIIENSRNIHRWKLSDDPAEHNLANLLHLSAMMAHSLIITDNNQPRFVGSEFLNTYVKELNFYLLYAGFLHQQNLKYFDVSLIISGNSNMKVGTRDTTSFTYPLSDALFKLVKNFDADKLEQLKKDRDFFSSILSRTAIHAERVYASVQEIKKANKLNGGTVGADTLHNFIEGIIDFSEEATAVSDTFISYFLDKAAIIGNQISNVKIDTVSGILRYTFTASKGKGLSSINLSDKTKPYFTVARTANDMILDIRKKNYVIALLKAVEITGELMPQQDLSRITEILQQVNAVLEDGNRDYWKTMFSFVTDVQETEKKCKERRKEAAEFMSAELSKIRIFYETEYETTDLLDGISTLKNFLVLVRDNDKIAAGHDSARKAWRILNGKDFQRLVISYYSKESLDVLFARLKIQLVSLKVKRGNRSVEIINSTEADRIVSLLKEYTELTFISFVKDTRADAKNLDKLNRKLLTEVANIIASYSTIVPLRFDPKLHQNMVSLIHFINDLAAAKNSDDVAAAIEAVALPSGSYAIKRNSICNISINSFPGIMPALEMTRMNGTTYGAFSAGFTAPLGFCISKGGDKGSSDGVFISVIDIGAVTRLRFDAQDSTSSLPEFNFSNILAPGIFYHHGFRKTPLSLNIGLQYGPNLRTINPDGSTKSYESMRLGVGLVLDIPLLNLHTKPRIR